jgi:hypothetical protein
MVDSIKTYIKYVLFHKWNKLNTEQINFLQTHWKHKPTKGLKLWVYNKVIKINGINTTK